MRIVFAFFAALVVMSLTGSLSLMFGEVSRTVTEPKFLWRKETDIPNRVAMIRMIAFAVLYFLLRLTIPKMSVPLALFVVFAVSIGWVTYLVIWWKQEGSKVSELIVLTIINAAVMLIGAQAAVRCDIAAPIAAAILRTIPPIAFVMSEGLVIADTIWFHEKLDRAENLISAERGES